LKLLKWLKRKESKVNEKTDIQLYDKNIVYSTIVKGATDISGEHDDIEKRKDELLISCLPKHSGFVANREPLKEGTKTGMNFEITRPLHEKYFEKYKGIYESVPTTSVVRYVLSIVSDKVIEDAYARMEYLLEKRDAERKEKEKLQAIEKEKQKEIEREAARKKAELDTVEGLKKALNEEREKNEKNAKDLQKLMDSMSRLQKELGL
jgi:hypothetical protein